MLFSRIIRGFAWSVNSRMKPYPECIKCIIDVRLNEILSLKLDYNRSIKHMLELLKVIREEFIKNGELTIMATEIFKKLQYMVPEIKEYYANIRKKSIDEALRSIDTFRKLLEKYNDYKRFRIATMISIAGNLLDTGVSGHRPPDMLDSNQILSSRFSIDHTKEIYDFVRKGKLNILWLFDNAGEAIYDTLLIEILRELGNNVVGVVKDDPGFQNDITLSDAYYAGLDKLVDNLISTGYSGSSIHLEYVSERFKYELERSDLVFAKGMAHFEYLHTVRIGKPKVFLLIPKCNVLARVIGVGRGSFVAIFDRENGSYKNPTIN